MISSGKLLEKYGRVGHRSQAKLQVMQDDSRSTVVDSCDLLERAALIAQPGILLQGCLFTKTPAIGASVQKRLLHTMLAGCLLLLLESQSTGELSDL